MLFLIATGLLYLALLVAALWAAFARGDGEIRRAAWITVAGVGGTAVANWAGPRFASLDYGILAVDTAMLAAYGAIALRTARWWPLWVTAAQLCAVITHFMPLTASMGVVRLYQLLQPAWMFVLLAALIWGAFSTRQPSQMQKSQL